MARCDSADAIRRADAFAHAVPKVEDGTFCSEAWITCAPTSTPPR
jgi:hypothetical protein